MQTLSRRLGIGSFGRRVALLAGGATLGRAVVVLATPLLTRLYSPDDFGLLAVFAALLGILGSLACLRYEYAIPLPARERTAASLLILCFILVAALGLLSLLAALLFAERVAALLNVPALADYLWLLPVALLGVGCYQALSYWAIRKQAFGRLARTRVAQGVGQVTLQLGWGLTAGGPAGLLAGAVVGQAAGVSTLASELRHDRQLFRTLSLRSLRWAMRRYWRFPAFATGSGLLNAGARQLPAILLAVVYGPQVAGWYALGQRVIRMPMQLVGFSVAQVYMSEAARLARRDPQGLRRLVLRLTVRMLLIGGLPLGAIALGGPWVFEAVFGPAWNEAGRYVQVLALAYLAQFVVAPVAQTLQILERQHIHLLWNAGQVAVMVLIFWLGYWLGFSPWHLLALYSVGMTLSYATVFLLVWDQTAPHRHAAVTAERTSSRGDTAQ